MQTRFMRGFFARATLATLIIAPLSVLPAVTATHAAGANAIISEINWAGSGLAGSGSYAADQWIEIYNPTTAPTRDLSTEPLQIKIKQTPSSAATTHEIKPAVSTILAPGDYLIVRNIPADPLSNIASSSSFLDLAPTVALPTLSTVAGASYALVDENTSTVLDTTEPASGSAPFLGRASAASVAPASMSRILVADLPSTVGSDPAGWRTSAVHGEYLRDTHNQYATPGAENTELKPITLSAVSPANSAVVGTPVVLAGDGRGTTSTTSTAQVRVVTKRVQPGGTTESSQIATNSGATAFSATDSALVAGRYQFAAIGETADQATGDEMPFVVSTGVTETNYLVFAATSTVASPVLTTPMSPTNLPTATITGTVTSDVKWVDISRNGQYYDTVPATSGAFTASVTLLPNQANVIKAVANVPGVGLAYTASVPSTVTVVSDTIAPVITASKLSLTANAPGTNDMLAGLAGTTEAAAFINLYADQAMTVKIAGPIIVAADGSFASTSIGDNLYAKVYVTATDVAGNVSTVATVTNTTVFAPVGGLTGLTVSDIAQSTFTVKWNAVSGAYNYRVRYRTSSGTFTSPVSVCATASATCAAQVSLVGLASDTHYIVSVAAVDQYGNVSSFSELETHTMAPIAVVVTPEPPVKEEVSTPVVKAPVKRTLAPTPAPVVTPAPSASPESGEVKAASTEQELNSTPWVFLGLLIVILVLATLGYFYWFGGASGEAVLASAKEKIDEDKKKSPPGGDGKNKGGKKW